jgi:murein L,D-transpeptidase YcbB/YkuD
MADGVVGADTLVALNLPLAARIEQVKANLERWRWLSRDLGRRYILVNIADFTLDVIEERMPVLSMRVIVGKPYRQTPAFSGTLTYVVFNPSWNIPLRIAVDEVLPGIVKDARMLKRERIHVLTGWGAEEREIDPATIRWNQLSSGNFPYYLRQDPGPTNPLGRIKFMLPNRYNVYLHDTPSKESFRSSVRGFSHGCIRLEHPLELAVYLFKESPEWNRERLTAARDQADDQAVFLPAPVPIHIVYWTAWVDGTGTLQLRDDIYGRDRSLVRALAAPPPGV